MNDKINKETIKASLLFFEFVLENHESIINSKRLLHSLYTCKLNFCYLLPCWPGRGWMLRLLRRVCGMQLHWGHNGI